MRKKTISVLLLLLLLTLAGWSQDVTGNLEGFILDSEGISIGGMNINVTGPSLQGIRRSTTNEQGYFRVLALPVGSYTVNITHEAYQEVTIQNVTVYLGKTTSLGEIRVQLKVIEAPEIVVTAEKPLFEPSTTALGSNLQASTYKPLPTERNFRSIISLLPQANTSYFGDETNIAGSTGLENVYFIDGINVTDPYRSITSTNLPYNFVKEIEVKQGGYEAEYGRALGGIVNVITYSGSNEFHGNVFGYLTNSQLAGESRRGLLDAKIDAFSTYDAGFSLGGPIVQDKIWFFLAYNKSFENQNIEIPGFGFHRDRKTRHMFAGKLTWQAANNIDVVLTVFGDPAKHLLVGSGEYYAGFPSALVNVDPFLGYGEEGGINISLQARSFVGRNLLLAFSVAHYTRSESQQGDTETGKTEPLFIDMATNTWSGGFGGTTDIKNVRNTANLKATIFLGSHTFKAGAEYEYNYLDFYASSTQPGIIQKMDEMLYIAGFWLQDFEVASRVPSLFLQDSWLVSERFRLNIGLRWDGLYQIGYDGKIAQRIMGQFQPRLGFSYQTGELGAQKIYGSFGRFYQQLPLHYPALGHTVWENGVHIYFLDPSEHPEAIVHTEWFVRGSPALSEIEGLEGEHFDEFTLGYERLLGRHFKFAVRGIYRTLRNAFKSGYDIEKGFVGGNPGKGDMSFLPKVKRQYSALELSVERTGQRWNFLASYVLSRNYGNYTGQYDSDTGEAWPGNNLSLQLAEQIPNSTGLLPNDRTHVFKFYGSYHFDFGIAVGTYITWQIGTPLNEFGGTSFGFGRYSFLVKRGSAGRTPAIWDLNFRFSYDVPIRSLSPVKTELIVDVLHFGSPRRTVLINQVRYMGLDVNGNQAFPNPAFGKALRYQPPMTVRVGLDISF